MHLESSASIFRDRVLPSDTELTVEGDSPSDSATPEKDVPRNSSRYFTRAWISRFICSSFADKPMPPNRVSFVMAYDSAIGQSKFVIASEKNLVVNLKTN